MRFLFWCAIAVLVCISARPCIAAEYEGYNIDGTIYSALAYSYNDSEWYDVQVVFDGSYVTLGFGDDQYLDLSLEEEEITNPSQVKAYDDDGHWDLVVHFESDSSSTGE